MWIVVSSFLSEGSNNSMGVAATISVCTVVKFTQLCEFTKFLLIVHFNQVSFIGPNHIPINMF